MVVCEFLSISINALSKMPINHIIKEINFISVDIQVLFTFLY